MGDNQQVNWQARQIALLSNLAFYSDWELADIVESRRLWRQFLSNPWQN
jgi:hypothetical protein